MNVDRALRGIAGTVILVSVALAWQVNGVDLTQPSWLWLTAFVGFSLGYAYVHLRFVEDFQRGF